MTPKKVIAIPIGLKKSVAKRDIIHWTDMPGPVLYALLS